MKKLTLLLLVGIALISCNAQEPDTECYSIGYVDSLTLNFQSEIDTLTKLNESQRIVIESLLTMPTAELSDSTGLVTITKEYENVYFRLVDSISRVSFNVHGPELQLWEGEELEAEMILKYNRETGSINLNKR